LDTWRTMVFTTLCFSEMSRALTCRSDGLLLTQLGILTNPFLLGAILLSFVLQLAVIYVPFLQRVFSTRALSLPQLLISLTLSTTVFVVIEGVKWIRQRTESRPPRAMSADVERMRTLP
jgi:Ca2+-transporting ATPase